MTTIGVHLHSDPAQLRATLASLARHAADAPVVLLPDAPDPDVEELLGALDDYPQLKGSARGAPAAFNRLIGFDDSPVVVFLESGVVLSRGALPRLVAAVTARAEVGLAGPSTNFVWNEQCLRPAPPVHAGPDRVEAFADAVATRFGDDSQTL